MLLFFYESINIVRLVSVHQAELFKVHFSGVVIIENLPHEFELFMSQSDSRKLAAGHELLERETAIEVEVEVSVRSSVVLELLLDAVVDLPQGLLQLVVNLFFTFWQVVCFFTYDEAWQLNGVFEVV